ncbi:hypothetical protein BG006_009653 [Podila minutissima]|uniref:Uncharacterized protein n=1 Tax=Podila minutissima TaxID=64525 RepID=A0A9P5SEH2_9FUNG|nr:hypothetical protein BG006_009653 [Podila minutissima]
MLLDETNLKEAQVDQLLVRKIVGPGASKGAKGASGRRLDFRLTACVQKALESISVNLCLEGRMYVLKPFKDVWLSCEVKEPIKLPTHSFEMGTFLYSDQLNVLLAYRKLVLLLARKCQGFASKPPPPKTPTPPTKLAADFLYSNIAENKGFPMVASLADVDAGGGSPLFLSHDAVDGLESCTGSNLFYNVELQSHSEV